MDREKELFEWIRGMYREMRPEDKKDAERFFPALVESEDERIRTRLIALVEAFGQGKYKDEMLTYLEKRKEQKPNIELIQRSWYMEGYHDREFCREPKWVIKTGEGGPKFEKNEKYGQPLEQKPAEWSEEDEKMRNAILQDLANIKAACPKINIQDEFDWLKSLRPQPKNELSEEDKEAFTIAHIVSLGYPIDANGNIPNYNQTFESCKSSLVYWLQQNLQKMLANKRIEPEGIRTETLLKDSYIQAYREGIEDSIRELSSQCENSIPQPHWKPSNLELGALRTAISVLTEERNFQRAGKHLQDILDHFEGKETRHDWKPSEEQMEALYSLGFDGGITYVSQLSYLKSLYNDLKKLM